MLLNSPCYGLTGLRVDAELVQDLGQDVRQLLREVVEGLELEDQWHHGVPRDRLTSQDNRINLMSLEYPASKIRLGPFLAYSLKYSENKT